MPLISNEVFDEPFTSIELTNAINRLPYTPDDLNGQFAWAVTRSPTTSVAINVAEGKVDIAPYVPRGGVPPVLHGTKRSRFQVEIPGLAGRASAMNREALNVTAGIDGAQRLESLEMLRAGKIAQIARSIDEGEKRQGAEAIRGLITDPESGDTVVDLLQTMSATQIEADLDLTDSKVGLNEQIEEIKEISEQALGGSASITGFKLIAAKDAHGAIRQSKDYRELLSDPMANFLAKSDGRKTVAINDNVDLVPYKYGYFNPNEAYLIPIYEGHAQIVYGPHEADEFWGNVQPRYVTSEPMPHGKGLEMEGWAFVLRYFQHPGAIIKVNVIPAAG